MEGAPNRYHNQDVESMDALPLPADLESLCLSRFDQLVARGQLIYEPSTGETVEDQGFKVSTL
jgi:hypothetical protein